MSSFEDKLSFWFSICGEKKEHKGEDSFLICVEDEKAVFGAFDGSGGSGARVYEAFGGHTGAYLASRIVTETTFRWFHTGRDSGVKGPGISDEDVRELERRITSAFTAWRDPSGGRIRSNLVREYPTTLAAAAVYQGNDGIEADILWCGDSRCYLLTPEGLQQLTEDDLAGKDAFENLREDAAMLNVISASKPFTIHRKHISVPEKAFLFAASDGCFGYLLSPMDFERLLLSTLERVRSVREWKETLQEFWKENSGDDYTLTLSAMGFENFASMQQAFSGRLAVLNREYPARGADEEEELRQQWNRYRTFYEAYLVSEEVFLDE